MARLANLPRYQSLSEEIRLRIEAGEYGAGDRLPSEAELCRQHGVSRGTAVKAVEQLVSEGVAIRRQGSGTFVARQSMHRRSGRLLSFSETAISDGREATQQVLKLEAADDALAREFLTERPAISLERLRFVNGVPCAYHHSLIPERIARQVPGLSGGETSLDPHFSLYDSLERAGHAVVRADERVTARLASPPEARLLNIDPPAAVIVVFRRSYDAADNLVEAVEAVHHSEYYTYDMKLAREPVAGSGRLSRVHRFDIANHHRDGRRTGPDRKEGD